METKKKPQNKGLQYFSKWSKEWVDFKNHPSIGELNAMKKYHYQIRENPNTEIPKLREVFKAYCCGKKRNKKHLMFLSNGYDGMSVFCKQGKGCKK